MNQSELSADAARVRTLLHPKTICVIGASEKPNTGALRIFKHLCDSAVQVFPVNPRSAEILGRKCYPSIAAIPESIDQAFIILGRPLADSVVDDCVAKGVASIVLISGGYAEVSEEGAQAQEAIRRKCNASNVAVLGPNCYGYVNAIANISGSGAAILTKGPLKRGNIGICSQSGGMGIAIFPWALENYGSGVSYAVNVGNQCDIELADVVAFMAEDEHTSTILLHAEGVSNGRRLAHAVAYAESKGKALVYLKVGYSQLGQEAALAHTGALGGADRIFEGLMRSHSAVRCVGCDETAFAAHLADRLHGRKLGSRIALISPSGGAVAQTVDVFGRKQHLQLAKLTSTTTDYLRSRLSAVSHVTNPIDLTLQAIADPTTFGDCASALLKDPGVDSVVVIITMNRSWEPVVDDLIALSESAEKPVLLLWIGAEIQGHSKEKLQNASRLPWTQSELVLADVLDSNASLSCSDFCKKVIQEKPSVVHDEAELGEHLREAGFSLPRGVIVERGTDAVDRLNEAGLQFPIIAKGLVQGITHKKKSGVLWMGLQSAEDITSTGTAFFDAYPDARLLLQETVVFNREWMIGYKRDSAFEGVLLFGAGGVDVESLDDIAYAMTPLDFEQAQTLVCATRAGRNAPAQELKLLAASLAKLSTWLEATDYDEVDFNPVVVDRDGCVRILDALGIQYLKVAHAK